MNANSFRRHSNGFYFIKGGKQVVELQGPVKSFPIIKKPIQQKAPIVKQPSFSFISNIPQGNYKLSITGSSLPAVNTLVGQKGFGFSGCNSVSVLCQTGLNGLFRTNNIVAANKKKCANDNDQKYLQVIKGVDGFVQSGKNFYLTQRGKKVAEFAYV